MIMPAADDRAVTLDRFVSLADVIRVHGRERPDKAALIYQQRTYAYAKLDAASNKAGHPPSVNDPPLHVD